MTDEEILVEFEAEMAANGEALKVCPTCKGETYRKKCPWCSHDVELTGDAVIDDVNKRVSEGADVSPADLERLLRGGFEPVPKGG